MPELAQRPPIQELENSTLKELVSKETRNKIFNFARQQGASPADADDIAQDIIVKAHQEIIEGNFRGEAKLLTWLYAICKHKIMDDFRRKKTRQGAGFTNIDEISDLSLNPLENLQRGNEEQKIISLEQAIETLDEKHKSVIELRLQQKSYKEISEILNIPKSTVMSRLHHAKNKLKTILPEDML